VTVSGGGLTLTSLELLGGDANDDNVIDATDATLIGGEYGNSGAGIGNAAADINADDAVDILDLTLMGGNFTETSAAAYAGWTP
jgi:hypothetical protein